MTDPASRPEGSPGAKVRIWISAVVLGLVVLVLGLCCSFGVLIDILD